MEYEQFKNTADIPLFEHQHRITSDKVMIEKETGRVVAVFYHDYDLKDVLHEMNKDAGMKPRQMKIKKMVS